MDTLEVFEEAIRKAGEEEPAATTKYTTRGHSERTETVTPPTDPISSGAPSTSATRGRGGGHGARPRPVKTQDPARAQRQLTHAQRTEQYASIRRAEGAAREAARLAPIPELDPVTTPTTTQPPLPLTPPSLQPPILPTSLPLQPPIPPTLTPLQPVNTSNTNPVDPRPANTTSIQEEERFYDTEVEDELELPSTSQLSGSKELRANQPEDELNSKTSKTDNLPNPNLK